MKIIFFFNRAFEIKDISPLITKLLKRGDNVTIVNNNKFELETIKSDIKYYKTSEVYLNLSKYKNFNFETVNYSSNKFLVSMRMINSQLEYLRRINEVSKKHFKKLSYRYANKIYLLKVISKNRYPFKSKFIRKISEKTLGLFEKLIYPNSLINFIKKQNPNLIFISNLVNDNSLSQNEVIKCSKKLNIKICYVVRSWDNLTNKGKINLSPDYFFTWNKYQNKEILDFHTHKDSKTFVIGPLLYEHLLNKNIIKPKKEFFEKLNIKTRKIITYVGSSPQIIQNELDYIFKLIENIIKNKILNEDTTLIIRMHPLQVGSEKFMNSLSLRKYNIKIEKLFKFENNINIKFIPSINSMFYEKIDKELYLNTIYHSEFLLGINTSATIEAMFYKKLTFVPPIPKEFNNNKNLLTDTFHFNYLNNDKDISPVLILDSLEKIKNFQISKSHQISINNFKNQFINLDEKNPPSDKLVSIIDDL